MTEFLSIDPYADEGWDDFVRKSPDGWVWGLAGWQRMIERVSEWDLRPQSFELRENGKRVAIMPLHVNPHGVAASSGWGLVGPMLMGGIDSSDRRRILKLVLSEATRRAVESGATLIQIGSMPITQSSNENLYGVNPFFEFGFSDTSTNSMVLDLTADEESLWFSMSTLARRQIRKAEREGFQAQTVDWAEELKSYYQIHVETYRRTGVAPHPLQYFKGISEEIAPDGHSLLWVGVSSSGEKVAYQNINVFGTASYYHTGCSLEVAQHSGVNYLIMWRAILAAKAQGLQRFDIGEVFFDVATGKQKGLTSFKSKFGGVLRRYYKASMKLVQEDVEVVPLGPLSDPVVGGNEQATKSDVSPFGRVSWIKSKLLNIWGE